MAFEAECLPLGPFAAHIREHQTPTVTFDAFFQVGSSTREGNHASRLRLELEAGRARRKARCLLRKRCLLFLYALLRSGLLLVFSRSAALRHVQWGGGTGLFSFFLFLLLSLSKKQACLSRECHGPEREKRKWSSNDSSVCASLCAGRKSSSHWEWWVGE